MATEASDGPANDLPKGHRPRLPGEEEVPKPKLPAMELEGRVPPEVQKAWVEYMVAGFKQNREMFERTLAAFMQPYYLTVWMYVILFAVGVGLFVVAAVIGLTRNEPVTALVFGGLGVSTFLALFVQQPLRRLEEKLEFITWLGISFNTYWTRVMYMQSAASIQQDLKAAEDDYVASLQQLIKRHAALRDGPARKEG